MLTNARLRIPALALGAAALAVGGCGGGSYDKSGSGGSGKAKPAQTGAAAQTLRLKADGDGGLYFEPKKLSGRAGSVMLVMTNPKSTGKEHGIGVRGNGVDQDGPVVKPGGIATVVAKLKPGKYTFYCNYDQHAKKGMKGTLTIQ